MLDWVPENVKWIFSGFGVRVVSYLMNLRKIATPTTAEVPEEPHKEASAALVEDHFWRGHVNGYPGATRNELAIVLLHRYPRWSSKRYLRRSCRLKTQPFDDALDELVGTGHIRPCCGFLFKLTGLGVADARRTADRCPRG